MKFKASPFNQLGANSESRVDKVILLDGRMMEIQIGAHIPSVDRDGNSRALRLDGLTPGNPLHESMYKCIKSTLSTHSLAYNQ
ncbi:hypothetical protein JW322_28830, partial [Pseudomonas syringae pv. papulans]